MSEAVCVVPVSPVRSQSSHKSEMVSQLLFGDVVIIKEEDKEWHRIAVQYDGYEGWCTSGHLLPISGLQINNPPAFTGEWVNKMYVNDVAMFLPFGCDISLFLDGAIGKTAFRYEGKLLPATESPLLQQVIGFSKIFLNTAYLWGGRSVFGIDCSGFSQLVYKLSGVRILRDAWQQAGDGIAVQWGEHKPGDLAFFHNDEGKVVHVGILLDQLTIIHAAGKVRMDRFRENGIINQDSGIKTHTLSGIRRYF